MAEVSDSGAIYPLVLAADLGAMALLAVSVVEAGRYAVRRLREQSAMGGEPPSAQ